MSDRVLRRWLATGRPARVGRALAADPDLAGRLDDLTALPVAYTAALEELVTPASGFEDRTAVKVKARVDGFGAASALVDLLGLGFHVGRALGGQPDGGDRTDGGRRSDRA